jgi:hypothetical protein
MKNLRNQNIFRDNLLTIFLASIIITTTFLSCFKPKDNSPINKPEQLAMFSVVDSITNRLAVAISNRNAEAAAEYVPRDERIVYVSNGFPIRGNEYIAILSNFYQNLDSLSFNWDKKEFSFLDPNTVLVIGWATIISVDKSGKRTEEKAVFTFTYSHIGMNWIMGLAHKESQ